MTPILLKPKGEINMRFSKQHKRQQLQEIGVSQGDVQKILFELRDTLGMVTEIKNDYKREAASSWELCDKANHNGAAEFAYFSQLRTVYLNHKVRETRLVNLIKKLKGLQ